MPMPRWLLALSLVLAGCGGGAPDQPGPTGEPTDPPAVEAPGPAADPPIELEPPPRLDDALQFELHGRWGGQPFWARLLPQDPALGGRLRLWEWQYTPPAPEAVGGSLLSDCPRLAVTSQLYVAWWEQEGGGSSSARYDADNKAYQVERWALTAIGNDRVPMPTEVRLPAPPSWDARHWPLSLAYAWRAGGAHRVDLLDLYGTGNRVSLSWVDGAVSSGDARWTITADAEGRLASLHDATGAEVLVVVSRAAPLDAVGIKSRREAHGL